MEGLKSKLLDTTRGDMSPATTFNASLNVHGVYDGLRFVVRLSPLIHDTINALPNGIRFSNETTFEQSQAFSTYLHETIHWWQHCGSTAGLLLSLSHAAQTHSNLRQLRRLIELVGPVKSIYQLALEQTGPINPENVAGLANIVINNQFDIEAYRFLMTNPDRADEIVNLTQFESMAHVYRIAQMNALVVLASTFDREFTLLPNPNVWIDAFNRLRADRVEGFFYGSDVRLSPIGAQHIFEGQARFSQLQYLHFGTHGQFDLEDADEIGMMSPLYTTAFEVFIEQAGLEMPPSLDHPTVGLFLLACDIAMNPGEGFPFPVVNAASFVADNDIGQRFLRTAEAIRYRCPAVKSLIVEYSAQEYAAASEQICGSMGLRSPLEIANAVARLVRDGPAFAECLALHDVGKAAPINQPVQVMFGQFASYCRDKLRHPEILCWPGAAMAGKHLKEESAGVFSRQSPLFVDRADTEMIVPVVRSGLDEGDVMETFQNFYNGQALYDLTRQWIKSTGPFTYNYRWLQPNGTTQQMKEWADRIFANAFGVEPDDFRHLGH
jgi:hypothetical protein